MTKLLIWIAVIFVLLMGLRLLAIAKAKRRSRSSGDRPAQKMVRCARCGVYVPQSEATPGPDGPTCGQSACTRAR